MPPERQPWFKFHTVDWRGDAKLKLCSLAARGLWIEMLAIMHEAVPYGHLVIAGQSQTPADLARFLGVTLGSLTRALAELEAHGVTQRTADGVLFSKRMVKDGQRAETNALNGSKGGSPKLISVKPSVGDSVKPSDKSAGAHAHLVSDLSLSGSGSSEREPERKPSEGAAALMPAGRFLAPGPMRGNWALPGRVPLHDSLLQEFMGKLGGDDPERRVRTWAAGVLAALPEGPVADSADSYRWWRARAAETLLPRGPVAFRDPNLDSVATAKAMKPR